MATLDEDLVRQSTGQKPPDVAKLTIKQKQLCLVQDLSSCRNLERVDLSSNVLTDASGLAKCHKLSWVNLATNNLSSLQFCAKLHHLTVLNVGNNSIVDMSPVGNLTRLKALILNNNSIKEVIGLDRLLDLNTIVLSHNEISSIDVSHLGGLTKLQLSHNQLTEFPVIRFNPELKNLSLNGNQIRSVPEEALGDNKRLELVDLGKNKIKKTKSIKALGTVSSIKTLNLLGNKMCETEDWLSTVNKIFLNLKVLNSKSLYKLLATSGKERGSQTEARDSQEESPSKLSSSDSPKKRKKTAKSDERLTEVHDDEDSGPKLKKIKKEKPISTVKESPSNEEDSSTETQRKKAKKKKEHRKEAEEKQSKLDINNKDSSVKDSLVKQHKKKKHKKDSIVHYDSEKLSQSVVHPEGIPATKDASSGVVRIKVLKKKKTRVNQDKDLFSAFESNIGTGTGSAW